MSLRPAAPALLLAIVLTSCSAQDSQVPAPRPMNERHGAPPISSPRDVTGFTTDPCNALLTEAQLGALGFDDVGRTSAVESTGEPSCEWGGRNSRQALDVVVVSRRDVLVDTYRVRLFAVFEPVEIGGLPAVREQSYMGSISCTITVGTADGQGLVTNYSELDGGQADDPCGRGQRAAEQMVANLPPLQK
ncbi:DUF3558 domain-containing protein [Actinomycetospora lutea]|uniref:DUF3558 domain-containing protein n=1 Tax=Actinomycetospora lutea TaxID=663604 RepID=UPI0023659748|nr:DUF3558 domain-containing protein [Actinomycetospora lutea]MDD7939363.1 DUF3558 domain-containing protein [Actinomycetospora lutea]